MRCDFHVVIERDEEGFYVASVPSLRGCHTQGRSESEVLERICEAVELCLDGAGERISRDATDVRHGRA